MKKTYKIHTYGCQMNVYDTQRLHTAFAHLNMEEAAPDNLRPDAIIFVTCSIRDKAEHKVLSELGLCKGAHDYKPLVVLCGCMAQRRGKELHSRYPWVRIVAGPRHLGQVPDAVAGCLSSPDKKKTFYLLDDDPRALCDLNLPPALHSGGEEKQIKSFVTIAHGCDHFCSYCIVPYVRGRFQSRNAKDILQEIAYLAQNGAREITLLGQNVNRYGQDGGDMPFSELLKNAAAVPGIVRVRYTTSHPVDFSHSLIKAMAETKGVCPAVNLPVQSGSDKILAAMGRGYTACEYENKIARLREAIPHVAVTSDLIVGFPGETQEYFESSVELLKRVRFDLVHTAAYSVRQGTKAQNMPEHVDEKTKYERLNYINAVQNQISKEINERYLGNKYEVLIDGKAPKGGGMAGRTATDKVVILPLEIEAQIGSMVEVEIKRAGNWYLYG